MKTVVALLVAANLLLFGAAQGWLGEEAWHRTHPNAGDPARMGQQVAPEVIRVIRPGGDATGPADGAGAPAPASAPAPAGPAPGASTPPAASGPAGNAGVIPVAAVSPPATTPVPAAAPAGAAPTAPAAPPAPAAVPAPAAPPAPAAAVTPAAAQPAATQPAVAQPSAQPVARLACAEFGPLPAEDAGKLLSRLRGEAGIRLGSRTQPESTTWLVHLPPQADRAALDKAAADLRAHGVEDFYVLQDPPAFRNAVSLGVFRSADGANTQAAQLGARGIKGIKVTARPSAASVGFVEVRDVAVTSQPTLDRAARDWPSQRWHACAAAVASR